MIRMRSISAGPKGSLQPGDLAIGPDGRAIFTEEQEQGLVAAGRAEFADGTVATAAEPEPAESDGPEPIDLSQVSASPAALQLAEEHKLDIRGLEGSGQNGLITKGDVTKALADRAEQDETAP